MAVGSFRLPATAVDRLDRGLAGDVDFGNGLAIEQRSLARLRVGLMMLGRQDRAVEPVAAAVAARDDRTLGALLRDPVVRNAFELDLSATLDGHLERVAMLARYLPAVDVDAGSPTRLMADPVWRAWPEYGTAWVLADIDSFTGPVAGRLRDLLRQMFRGPAAVVPITPTADERAALRRGAALLTELLPGAAETVLRHIGVVGLASDESADGRLHSVSGSDGFPGAIFIAPDQLENPWDTAGRILHEGLHQALFEIDRCTSLLATAAPEADEVPIPWRAVTWPVRRTMLALHVYVYLALFQAAVRVNGAQLHDRYGPPPESAGLSPQTPGGRNAGYDSPVARASHLAEQIERVRPHRLTPYGRRFVAWLVDALEQLAPGVRAGWQPEAGPEVPAVAPPDSPPPPQGPFRVVRPAASVELVDQDRLLVATSEPPRMHWLNLPSWTIYALCDGQDLSAIQAAYVELTAASHPQAPGEVAAGLRQLVDSGLVAVDTQSRGGG